MKSIVFYIVDVFGEDKYQGNQLAVFCDTGYLSNADMQRMANEIDFAETTFILSDKKTNNGYDVKIFTPDVEIPFAGHPTLGTAYIIRKVFENESTNEVNLNLGVGQIPVKFEESSDIWMKQKEPQFGATFEREELAEILNITSDEIDSKYPVQQVSTGLPSVIVPLKSLDSVKKCCINHSKYKCFLDKHSKLNILVFSKETYSTENDLNVRVFCDDTGYPEDAATGSANGNLAGYLLEHKYFNSYKLQYRVEQGYEKNRRSLIKIKADKIKDKFDINVGGKVFTIAKGEWFTE